MKIILGVCGFGLGHSIRQRPILEGLIAHGHEVILIANDASYHYFSTNYPQTRLVRVYVPAMHVSPRGLDFAATANDPRNAEPEITRSFWNACGTIEQQFGTPDRVISDYDMVSAQVAYLFGAPLITLDQQSKFLGYDFPTVNGYGPEEHRMRLGYFFPKARARIATSFFKVNYIPRVEYPVTIIPPIIGQDIKGQRAEPLAKRVTVYISSASELQQPLDALMAVFAAFPDYTFMCFTDGHAHQPPPNVVLRPPGRAEFLACLGQSSAVISTAGHNLITEALYLRVPLFLLPFNNYEQQLNAHVIAGEGLGYAASAVDAATLRQFFNDLDAYRHAASPLIYRRYDGATLFLDMLDTL